jgi:hypothetical protein
MQNGVNIVSRIFYCQYIYFFGFLIILKNCFIYYFIGTLFLPKWNRIAKSISKHVSTMKCYSMNGELNDVYGLNVESYPTLIL